MSDIEYIPLCELDADRKKHLMNSMQRSTEHPNLMQKIVEKQENRVSFELFNDLRDAMKPAEFYLR